jgi:hypothetical protein
MTKKTKRKLQFKMRRAFKKAAAARRKHERLVKAYRKIQKQYRAA